MRYAIRVVSTYSTASHIESCGIDKFTRAVLSSLKDYTGEFGEQRVAAISDRKRVLESPVDLSIDKYDKSSWVITSDNIRTRIIESGMPTVVLLEYEGGLIPEFDSTGKPTMSGDGAGYLDILKQLQNIPNVLTYVQIHTALPENSKDFSKNHLKNLRGFGKLSDGLLVMINGTKELLTSRPYNISPKKIHVIPHPVRENMYSEEQAKAILRIPDDQFIVSQPGLQSLNKGNDIFVRGCGNFMKNSLTVYQGRRFTSCLAGRPHPSFIKQEGGKYYEIWKSNLDKAISESEMKVQNVDSLMEADFVNNDLVIVREFLPEEDLKLLYSASAAIATPYPNLDQASSGAGSDCESPGTPLISTKTRWAMDTLNPYRKTPEKGIVVTDRGILIDWSDDTVTQLAAAIDYLAFTKGSDGEFMRVAMGNNLFDSGLGKRWSNYPMQLLEVIEKTKKKQEQIRLAGFQRKKKSSLASIINNS